MAERWAVPLDGESIDFMEAKELFPGGPIRVREVRIAGNESATVLQADELESKNDYIEVLATAERLLDYVNGALFLSDAERRPLRVSRGGAVRERGEAGIYDRQSVVVRFSAALRAKASIAGVHVTADGQSSAIEKAPRGPIEAAALALTIVDGAVRDVLNHLRADPDFPTLYSAYERIKSDVREAQKRWRAFGQSGPSPTVPWAKGTDNEFRRSAQPFRHGDPDKWAGKNRETAMPLAEARTLVRGWTLKWLACKRKGG